MPSSAASCVATLTALAATLHGGCPAACTAVLCRTPLGATCVAGRCAPGG